MLVDKEGFCRERTCAQKRTLARQRSPKGEAHTCGRPRVMVTAPRGLPSPSSDILP